MSAFTIRVGSYYEVTVSLDPMEGLYAWDEESSYATSLEVACAMARQEPEAVTQAVVRWAMADQGIARLVYEGRELEGCALELWCDQLLVGLAGAGPTSRVVGRTYDLGTRRWLP